MTTRAPAVRWLAPGDAGVRETLRTMRQLVTNAILDPNFVWWARGIVQGCSARDDACVLGTLRGYVGSHLTFMRDPVGVENVTPPLVHMRQLLADPGRPVLGDCDDAATLSAALVMAVGYPARFVALAFQQPCAAGVPCTPQDAPYSHVYTEALSSSGWVQFDTTRGFQNIPPTIGRTLVYPL